VHYECKYCSKDVYINRKKVLNSMGNAIEPNLASWCDRKCRDNYNLDINGINCVMCSKRFIPSDGRAKRFCTKKCATLFERQYKNLNL